MNIRFLSLFLIIAVAFLSFACHKRSEPAASLTIGSLVPEVSFKDNSGRTKALSSYRGKAVLLSFWASWCAPCLEELPSLERLQQALSSQGFSVVGINVDPGSSSAEVQKILEKLSIRFENFSDPEGDISLLFGVYGIPHNVIIDSQGRLAFQEYGPKDWDKEENRAMIRKLLRRVK